MKRMAVQRSARVTWTLGALSIAGVVVGLGTWFSAHTVNRDGLHLSLSLGLGFGTFCLGCILGRFLFPIPRAVCPQCGCDWNVESGNDLQKWLRWQCCPRCGLEMSDDTG